MDSTAVVQLIQTVTAELDSIAQALQSVQSIPAELDSVAQSVRHVQVVATELDSIAQIMGKPVPWYQTTLGSGMILVAISGTIAISGILREWYRGREGRKERMRRRSNLVQVLFEAANRQIDRAIELHAFLWTGGDGLWRFPVEYIESLSNEIAKMEPRTEISHMVEEFIVQLNLIQSVRDVGHRMREEPNGRFAYRNDAAARLVGPRVSVLVNIYNKAVDKLREAFPAIKEVTRQHLREEVLKWQGAPEIRGLAEQRNIPLDKMDGYFESYLKKWGWE